MMSPTAGWTSTSSASRDAASEDGTRRVILASGKLGVAYGERLVQLHHLEKLLEPANALPGAWPHRADHPLAVPLAPTPEQRLH